MRKHLTKALFLCILMLCVCATVAGCKHTIFSDKQSDDPSYHYVGEGENRRAVTFMLELRQPSEKTAQREGDRFSHSETDGELIAAWEIPVFGNTIYESVKEYFQNRDEHFTFRTEQHKFYMFHNCTLADGTTYDLETVYIAVDGEYAYCANYQSLLGDDGVAGTEDDVQVVVLVYRGWICG